MATLRWMSGSNASYTVPKPPAPIFATSSYLPILRPVTAPAASGGGGVPGLVPEPDLRPDSQPIIASPPVGGAFDPRKSRKRARSSSGDFSVGVASPIRKRLPPQRPDRAERHREQHDPERDRDPFAAPLSGGAPEDA